MRFCTVRPDAQQAVAVVRLAVRRGTPGRNDPNPPLPHIPCPVCRQRWSDIDSIARAALAMPQWPEPTVPEQAAEQQAPALQQAPRRPAVPTVMCGGPQREEMDWTTYRRQIRDRTDPLQSTRGAWIGEWHCTARACAGTRTAEAEFTGVRTLWQRVPPPHGVLPPCRCGVTPLVPMVFHNPGAVQSPWAGS